MTTREDLDKMTQVWLSAHSLARDVHQRDGHCGELFVGCPFFPCNVARDIANELLREYKRLNNKPLGPTLVKRLDMCAVAENL